MRSTATFSGSSASAAKPASETTMTSGVALPASTASRPNPFFPGARPMSRAPRKFAAASSPSTHSVFDLILRGRDLSTTTSRFGQARWSASLRSRKFSSFDRWAEPRKKRPAGPVLSIIGADLARGPLDRDRHDGVPDVRAFPDRRLVDVPRVERLGQEPPVVAQPVVVDGRVQARQEPVDDVVLGLDRDVAADVAARAHGLGLLEVPDAAAEAEVAHGQGADRADVRGAARPVVGERRAVVRPDERAAAAVEERQLARAGDLLA